MKREGWRGKRMGMEEGEWERGREGKSHAFQFCQLESSEDRDERFTVWGQKVKSQGHS